MDLIASVSDNTKEAVGKASSSQMTIFYNGQVPVINDICYNKAKEIMQLIAAHHHSTGNSKPSSCSMNLIALMIGRHTNNNRKLINDSDHHHDMPIPRKGSFRRFFEKRSGRSTTRAAPYRLISERVPSSMSINDQTDDPSSSRTSESLPWQLALAAARDVKQWKMDIKVEASTIQNSSQLVLSEKGEKLCIV